MKLSAMHAGAVLLISAASPAMAAQSEQEGYRTNALGVSAILSGDYKTAAWQLDRKDGVSERDPAWLINRANAYAGLGRYQEASQAYRAAMEARPIMLTLADGSVRSSREIARAAINRLGTSYAGL